MAATATRAGAGRRTSGPKLRVPTDRQVNQQDTDRESAAYDAGRDGRDPPGADEPQYVHDAYHLGRQDRGEEPSESEPSPRAQPPDRSAGSKLSIADEGAPFLLGLLAYCLAINYLRYGWPGVTGWLSAKFTNQVTIGSGSSSSSSAVLIPNANPATGTQVPQAPVVMA